MQWKCKVCGYIHEGVEPPAECPICRQGKEVFEMIKEDVLIDSEATKKQDIKNAIRKLSYGMYIITSHLDDKINGQAANTVFQISSDPCMLIGFGMEKKNYTAEMILDSKTFTVNILGIDGQGLVRKFGYRSGRDTDKFAKLNYQLDELGNPRILEKGVIGYLSCKVYNNQIIDCGDHWMVLAEVIDGKVEDNENYMMSYEFFRKTKNEN